MTPAPQQQNLAGLNYHFRNRNALQTKEWNLQTNCYKVCRYFLAFQRIIEVYKFCKRYVRSELLFYKELFLGELDEIQTFAILHKLLLRILYLNNFIHLFLLQELH